MERAHREIKRKVLGGKNLKDSELQPLDAGGGQLGRRLLRKRQRRRWGRAARSVVDAKARRECFHTVPEGQRDEEYGASP